MNSPEHVVVIGAGVIGAASAFHLLEAGHRVTILEPEQPGSPHATSYGNAGWLSSHSVLPPAAPGVWKQVPKWLADPLGPLAIRWKYFPRAFPWLMRYLAAAWTYPQVEKTASALRTLLAKAPELHEAMAQQAGLGELIARRGLLHAYLSREEFEKDARAWQIRRKEGIEWQELDQAALRALEPSLHSRYTFGVLVPETGSCTNPGAYTAGLVRYAQERGAKLVQTQATGFELEHERLKAVVTEHGSIPCSRAVIAVGSRAKNLASMAGDKVSLETERGYHAVLHSPQAGPNMPTMFADCKVITSTMQMGLRIAGQVEIAENDDTPNWRRADILCELLVTLYPALAGTLSAENIDIWMGRRPSTPDGLPCIGLASGSKDIIHAYGHGHVGLVSSARTGRLVAQLASGLKPEISLAPFSPQRFS